MAEFQEVMKHRNRICEYYARCIGCPLSIETNGTEYGCVDFEMKCPQQAEEIIMKWAEEHPVQTNADKFKEVFGIDVNNNICVFIYEGYCPIEGCKKCDKYNFWQQEYKEPKGE